MDGARMLRSCLFALTVCVLGAGCPRSAPLQSVGGKVSYRGVVLNNGVVVFTPDAGRGESGPVALGTIREDGTYQLSTGDAAGATPGWYRVTVAAFATLPPKTAPADQFQPPAPLLPEKYRDPELSLLRCQVKPNQPNTIDLLLD
jgi:hypothetical protein